MSEFILTHQECPCGDSSDAYSINKDGSGFCFSCNKFNKAINEEIEINTKLKDYQSPVGEFKIASHRGISEGTMDYYQVFTKFVNDVPIELGFKYPNTAFKIRLFSEKKFFSTGPMKDAGLFGVDRFDPGSKESITITEGELDALSVYEMSRGNTAAVSIKSASSGKKDCIKDWDYINSFKKIILCLDNDEPGQNAAREIASLFDFNKVYQVKLHRFKDANDYLQNQSVNDFIESWKNARRYAPDNIISTFAEIENSLAESKESQIGTYPFRVLNDNLFGLHEGEVIVFKGGEGIGKTEVFRAIEHHLLKTTKHNICIIHLEEDNSTTIKALAGYELEVPAVLPDCGISTEDILKGYKQAVNNDDSRVNIYSSFDVEDENTLLDNVRFCVTALGCKFVFLDHITWLATGMQDEDERRKLDRLSQKLKLLAKELKFCLIEISHTNDEGKTRGSRNITKVANTVVHLIRNLLTSDINERNTIYFTIEKARLGGRTGPAGRSMMNTMTGKLEDFN